MALILHGGDYLLGVDDIAAEGHGDVAEAGLPGHGLAFPEAYMADPPVAGEVEKVLFVEGVSHLAVVSNLVYVMVESGDPAEFLTPVLEKINPVVDVVGTGKYGINAEYSAIVSNFLHLEMVSYMVECVCRLPITGCRRGSFAGTSPGRAPCGTPLFLLPPPRPRRWW